MFNPSWRGVIDWKKGLYYSNKNHTKDTINTKDIIDTEDTKDTKNIIDTKYIKDIIDTKDTKEDILDITDTNKFNFINSTIPYYNINLEYLKSETHNQYKYNNNYYNVLDRIGYISRYLLKGNDYYKLYISKNANKYFTHETDDNSNNLQNINQTQNENEPI